MIREENGTFILETEHTTYSFWVMPGGYLEHLYYGRKIHMSREAFQQKYAFAPGTTVVCKTPEYDFSLDDSSLEMSGRGRGDYREPLIDVICADGSTTTNFLYKGYEITEGVEGLTGLPTPQAKDGQADTLHIFLEDEAQKMRLELIYVVFADCDVIARSSRVYNLGEEAVRIQRLMSMQLDFKSSDYEITTFHGAWIREMGMHRTSISAGTFRIGSLTGNSSNMANPFFMLSRKSTTEQTGEAYGFNLVYSGNHTEICQVNSYDKLRVLSGINPDTFAWDLAGGDCFEAPYAVMTYSAAGFSQMSVQMHAFVRHHIVREAWSNRIRPVLLNSWEASYFKISESKLLRLAKQAKEVGVELFVMDDGWFLNRNDDTSSLGDWICDEKKLPNGLKGIADMINAMGMDFGIWVEPEMVSVNSELYRKHPEWAIQVSESTHAEGRNQRILDLSNSEVCEYIINEMSRVFSSANISYVKWDMNRNFSDYFSKNLSAQQQMELSHRYVLGLYHCMQELTKRFPDILFEGCASGGNRFDLGILSYFPQIWASDDTDACERATIQNGYSYGYPQNVYTAHVSDVPNHQTLRNISLATRFNVAAFGNLGYECNLCDYNKEELAEIGEQIALYKKIRKVMQLGTFYRTASFDTGETCDWCVVSQDKKQAVGLAMEKLIRPNHANRMYYAAGLNPDKQYRFRNIPFKINIKEFGGLINTATPVHIRPDSLVHHVASKMVKMDSETEDMTAYGDAMMYGGIQVASAFAATGFNDKIRLMKDFSSRMYFIEEI